MSHKYYDVFDIQCELRRYNFKDPEKDDLFFVIIDEIQQPSS